MFDKIKKVLLKLHKDNTVKYDLEDIELLINRLQHMEK